MSPTCPRTRWPHSPLVHSKPSQRTERGLELFSLHSKMVVPKAGSLPASFAFLLCFDLKCDFGFQVEKKRNKSWHLRQYETTVFASFRVSATSVSACWFLKRKQNNIWHWVLGIPFFQESCSATKLPVHIHRSDLDWVGLLEISASISHFSRRASLEQVFCISLVRKKCDFQHKKLPRRFLFETSHAKILFLFCSVFLEASQHFSTL